MEDPRQLSPLELATLAMPMFVYLYVETQDKAKLKQEDMASMRSNAMNLANSLYQKAAKSTDGPRD